MLPAMFTFTVVLFDAPPNDARGGDGGGGLTTCTPPLFVLLGLMRAGVVVPDALFLLVPGC